jgi:hypothetical protein
MREKRKAALGGRPNKSGEHGKDTRLRPKVLDGRARFLADATSRAFAAGIQFTIERLAALAEVDPETRALYAELMARFGRAA